MTPSALLFDSLGKPSEINFESFEALPLNGFIWIAGNAKDEKFLEKLKKIFSFHPLSLEDARKQNQRPKVDTYDDYIFISLKGWVWDGSAEGDFLEELDLFYARDYLVSVAASPSKLLQVIHDRLNGINHTISHPAELLYVILDPLVDSFFVALDQLSEEVDELEERVYSSTELLSPLEALPVKKRLVLARQTVSSLRGVITVILHSERTGLPPTLFAFFQDVYDHTVSILEQIDLQRDILSEVVDSIHSLSANRLNQVMKTLTAVSTVLMSMSLVAGIYGMNFKYMPELDWPGGYPFALALMLAIALLIIGFFKKIKWL